MLRWSFIAVLWILVLNVHPLLAVNPDELDEIDYEIWDLMDGVKRFNDGNMQTFYEFINVSEDIVSEDLVKSIRKLSLTWHPDKNKSPDAQEKFQLLNAIGRILKQPDSRSKYNYWMVHGIPYWRGRGYYFRKSENLSVFQSLMVILFGFSAIQYISKLVRYSQVKAGLRLLDKERKLNASSEATQHLSRKSRQKLRRMKSQELGAGKFNSSQSILREAAGVFDDANMKCAIDWLIMERGIPPEICLNEREWVKMIKQDFEGDEKRLVVSVPKPWHTMVFVAPLAAVRWILFNKKSQGAEKTE